MIKNKFLLLPFKNIVDVCHSDNKNNKYTRIIQEK